MWDSASNMSVVIHGHRYDLTNFNPPAAARFDGNISPITTVGTSLGMMLQKKSTSIALVLLQEPLVQLSPVQLVFSIGVCTATSIAV